MRILGTCGGRLNVNTAAVVMTAAVYALRREPLLVRGSTVKQASQ